MRQVKFKYWIPAKWNDTNNKGVSTMVPGTNCLSIEQYGLFHCFMQVCDMDGAYPVAIVEGNNGKCYQVDIDHMEFIGPVPE